MKVLFLKNDTIDGNALSSALVSHIETKFKGEIEIIVRDSSSLSPKKLMSLIIKTDIQILDGTIEPVKGILGSNYKCIVREVLSTSRFWVVTRNTLPMNVVPVKSNINKFDSLRQYTYKVDGNEISADFYDNDSIVRWITSQLESVSGYTYTSTAPMHLGNVLNRFLGDIKETWKPKNEDGIPQVFISFRGKYEAEKYHGYSLKEVISEINDYHKFRNEKIRPIFYSKGELTSEFMPELRIWTVHNFIHSRISDCNEFWIFETEQTRDIDGNIITYSYWDSWWCLAEVMSVLQLAERKALKTGFKMIIFNPLRENKFQVISEKDLPALTEFESREFMRLRGEGNLLNTNLDLRKDKQSFRDSPYLIQRVRYWGLCKRWELLKNMTGQDLFIPFETYVEDVNCHCYEDNFLFRRIHMSYSCEIGRTFSDIFRRGFWRELLNLNFTDNSNPYFTGIYSRIMDDKELEMASNHSAPLKVYSRKECDFCEIKIKRYGTMYYFWPLNNQLLLPERARHTGPEGCVLQKIPLYKVI